RPVIRALMTPTPVSGSTTLPEAAISFRIVCRLTSTVSTPNLCCSSAPTSTVMIESWDSEETAGIDSTGDAMAWLLDEVVLPLGGRYRPPMTRAAATTIPPIRRPATSDFISIRLMGGSTMCNKLAVDGFSDRALHIGNSALKVRKSAGEGVLDVE